MFPGGDLGDELLLAVDAPVEALAAQHADFDLDHVEPAGVLGDVVELQPAQHPSRFGGGNAWYSAPAEWVDRLSRTTRMRSAAGNGHR